MPAYRGATGLSSLRLPEVCRLTDRFIAGMVSKGGRCTGSGNVL